MACLAIKMDWAATRLWKMLWRVGCERTKLGWLFLGEIPGRHQCVPVAHAAELRERAVARVETRCTTTKHLAHLVSILLHLTGLSQTENGSVISWRDYRLKWRLVWACISTLDVVRHPWVVLWETPLCHRHVRVGVLAYCKLASGQHASLWVSGRQHGCRWLYCFGLLGSLILINHLIFVN